MKNKLVKTIIFAILMGAFIGADMLIGNIESAPLWLGNVIRIAAMAFGVLACVELLGAILKAFSPKSHRGKTLITISISLINYVAALIILCWGLNILGVNVGTIVASVGILTLVVGFGAESLIADVITGFFMIFENQYNVGDIVEVGGFRGTVVAIGIRTTSIADAGNNIRIINNSDMKNITNKSDHSSAAICDFSIPYETDLLKLEEKIPGILDKIYNDRATIMNAKPVYLGVQELSASSVVLRFKAEVPEKEIYNATRALNHDLFVLFREAGIECPYTQVTLHQGQ